MTDREPRSQPRTTDDTAAARPLERARETIARNLAAARGAIGSSQDALAAEAGVSRATIIQLEAAEGDPRLSTLAGVAAALGVSPLFLLLGRDELDAIARAPASTEAEKVRRHLPADELETMRRLLRSGLPRNTAKAVAIGSEAVTAAGLKKAALVGAAIGTVLMPGLGTQIGAALGAWRARRRISEAKHG
jgi:transcriptional regulator with XRE-family HTH domain